MPVPVEQTEKEIEVEDIAKRIVNTEPETSVKVVNFITHNYSS